jgi:hypothetical protein
MDINFVKEFNSAWFSAGFKLSKKEMDGGQVKYCIGRETPKDEYFDWMTPTALECITELAKKFKYQIGVDFSNRCLDIYLNNN